MKTRNIDDTSDEELQNSYRWACESVSLWVDEIKARVLNMIFDLPEYGFCEGRLPDEPDDLEYRTDRHEQVFNHIFESARAEFNDAGQQCGFSVGFEDFARCLPRYRKEFRRTYSMIIFFKVQIAVTMMAARLVRLEMRKDGINDRDGRWLDRLGALGKPCPYEGKPTDDRLPDLESWEKIYGCDYLAVQIARDYGIEVLLPSLPLKPEIQRAIEREFDWKPRRWSDEIVDYDREPAPMIEDDN